MSNEYYMYILANTRNTVLYTGVTNDLGRRVSEHKAGMGGSFTKRYNVINLLYYESTNDINLAISREKQIKSWSRGRKEKLINSLNPKWRDFLIIFRRITSEKA